MKMEIDVKKNPTKKQVQMLKEAAKMPIPEDAEYKGFSEEQLNEFVKISKINKSTRNKETVSLRLSPQALSKAKSLGKGYTSVLSRILENALSDSNTIKKFL